MCLPNGVNQFLRLLINHVCLIELCILRFLNESPSHILCKRLGIETFHIQAYTVNGGEVGRCSHVSSVAQSGLSVCRTVVCHINQGCTVFLPLKAPVVITTARTLTHCTVTDYITAGNPHVVPNAGLADESVETVRNSVPFFSINYVLREEIHLGIGIIKRSFYAPLITVAQERLMSGRVHIVLLALFILAGSDFRRLELQGVGLHPFCMSRTCYHHQQ